MRSALLASALLLSVSMAACIESDGSGGNSPPIADIRWEGVNKVGKLIHFYSDGCKDPDGDALSFNWDFGDGSKPWPSTTTRVYHRYQEVGTYTISLTVSDGKATDSATMDIDIGESPNQRPEADIDEVGMVFLDNSSGEARVMFDASGSTDDDGDPLTYLWDFDDRVDVDNDTITTNDLVEDDEIAYFTYDVWGDLNVTLVVSDGELNDTAQVFVMVRWPTPRVDFSDIANHGIAGWELWVANHTREDQIGSYHYWIVRGTQTMANGTLSESGDPDVFCRDDDSNNNLTDGDNIFVSASAAEADDIFILSYIPNEIAGEWHGGEEAEVAWGILPE
ncbi:MAG: PKD domain-containing protein [Thermoplasmata archaeon]|nr:PKD domain-containing protein [Thermoplasmata archaeon]